LTKEERVANLMHVRSLLLRACAAIAIGFLGMLAWFALYVSWQAAVPSLPQVYLLVFLLPGAVLVFGLALTLYATYLFLRL
jgi:hypothetical protein